MRIIIVPFLLVVGLIWGLYNLTIKKNTKKGKEIISITLFFGGVWALIFYWLLS